jgi:predicted LPLAT superfamily acyltransferase
MVYFFLRRGQARRAAIDFLNRLRRFCPGALPGGATPLLAYRLFINFGDNLLMKLVGWSEPPDPAALRIENPEILAQAADSGTGCLVVASHFGNLEYARSIAHRHPELVVNVLLHDAHARNFARLMQQESPASRMNLLQVTELDVAMTLQLKAMVERGEWVVIAGDRIPVTAGGRTSPADFLGAPAPFPVGPWVLASVLRCPVYLLHCFPADGRFILRMDRFAQCLEMPRQDRADWFASQTAAYASALQAQVLRAPLQWFNFHDFWAPAQEEEKSRA